MKPIDLDRMPSAEDDAELVVLESHSMSMDPKLGMMSSNSTSVNSPRSPRGDPPGPALSLSFKSCKSATDAARKKVMNKKKKDGGATSSRSPRYRTSQSEGITTNARDSTRSPRTTDALSDYSREPPENVTSVSRSHSATSAGQDHYYRSPASSKGAEPPAVSAENTEDFLPVFPFLDKNRGPLPSSDPEFPDQMEDNNSEKSGGDVEMKTLESPMASPAEFKASKSSKSVRSSKTRSSSKRRKAAEKAAAAIAMELAESQANLRGVFSGHLAKWRFEAEEAGPFIRIPAFLGANALIGTTTYALIFDASTWTILDIVLSLVIYAIALLSVILEGRFLCSNPLGIRAHLRSALTRRNRVFRYVWGRGVMYMLAGGLSCAMVLPPCIITGAFMALIGFTALVIGGHSARMFFRLRDSLKDDEYLVNSFKRYDYDKDGFVTLPEFVNLLSALGMDLDDRVGIKAFHAADVNHEYKISEEAFISWWKTVFSKDERTQKYHDIESDLGTDEEEGNGYHRMS